MSRVSNFLTNKPAELMNIEKALTPSTGIFPNILCVSVYLSRTIFISYGETYFLQFRFKWISFLWFICCVELVRPYKTDNL